MNNVDDTRQKTMDYENTVKFFNEWTSEQGINTLQLIMEIYTVIRMYHPKRNTFYLQGTNKAGKTHPGVHRPPQGQGGPTYNIPVFYVPRMFK